MGARRLVRHALAMAEDPTMNAGSTPLDEETRVVRAGTTLTTAEYAALARELEALRGRHRAELAERLRLARGFGGSADNDDLLAVLEEAAIEEARIAQLEEQVRSALVVDVALAGVGAVGLGALVRVVDGGGDECEYEMVGRRSPDSRRHEVTPASPVGEALLGARAGDVVRVELPSGRVRVLEVLDFRYPEAVEAA
jgi:transcription elongation factor GreA